jgi:hypothetical protein
MRAWSRVRRSGAWAVRPAVCVGGRRREVDGLTSAGRRRGAGRLPGERPRKVRHGRCASRRRRDVRELAIEEWIHSADKNGSEIHVFHVVCERLAIYDDRQRGDVHGGPPAPHCAAISVDRVSRMSIYRQRVWYTYLHACIVPL